MTSITGATTGGSPLAFNRSPRAELKPWVVRIGVTSVEVPEGHAISCGTFSEHPAIRHIYGAKWSAETADGHFEYDPGERGLALYFGPCTRMMRLVAHGSFRVVSIYFAPGGTLGLDLPAQQDTLDRIIPMDPYTRKPHPASAYHPRDDAEDWFRAAEAQLFAAARKARLEPPDPILADFERLCFTNPNGTVGAFAETIGVTRRTLERTIRRAWGVSPKVALRRARALDMAAALLAVAEEQAAAEMRLRYFDQSHLNREMRDFFGMTPGQIQAGSHPLLTITVEMRQSRRLDALAKLGIDEPRPWRDPAAEPKGNGASRA